MSMTNIADGPVISVKGKDKDKETFIDSHIDNTINNIQQKKKILMSKSESTGSRPANSLCDIIMPQEALVL
jgi:hypothetical protein